MFSPEFEVANEVLFKRGKRSIAMRIGPENTSLLAKLIQDADIVIDPLRKGILEELGVDYEQVRTSNPRLVWARISGFPESLEENRTPSHDIHALALSGLLAVGANYFWRFSLRNFANRVSQMFRPDKESCPLPPATLPGTSVLLSRIVRPF
jgi:hypothetical protein